MGTIRSIFILLLLTLVALPALADEKSAAEGKDKEKTGEQRKETRATATMGEDGVQRVAITGGDYYFEPNYIIVKVGKPVELKVRKVPGRAPHNLTVKAPEAGIDVRMDLKEEPQTVRFTPTKVGRYPLYCDKKLLWMESHREKGMEGTIEVVE